MGSRSAVRQASFYSALPEELAFTAPLCKSWGYSGSASRGPRSQSLCVLHRPLKPKPSFKQVSDTLRAKANPLKLLKLLSGPLLSVIFGLEFPCYIIKSQISFYNPTILAVFYNVGCRIGDKRADQVTQPTKSLRHAAFLQDMPHAQFCTEICTPSSPCRTVLLSIAFSSH